MNWEAAALIAITGSALVTCVDLIAFRSLARRLRAVERATRSPDRHGRILFGNHESVERIQAAVFYVERQQAAEATLMAAIGEQQPVQLYRREGSRFVPHDVRP